MAPFDFHQQQLGTVFEFHTVISFFKKKKKKVMASSSGVGFVTVFAISGSVVLLALQAHKRLLSDFMKKVESELGASDNVKYRPKKKVRFADDVLEPSSNNKEYRMRRSRMSDPIEHSLQMHG